MGGKIPNRNQINQTRERNTPFHWATVEVYETQCIEETTRYTLIVGDKEMNKGML